MPRVLRLPSHGTLLISTDLQGNLGDFERLLALLAEAGPDAWLVLTGDLVHGPSDDLAREDPTVPFTPQPPRSFDHARWPSWPGTLGTPYRDESPRLLDAFLDAQRTFPGRVWCLLGNHDHGHVGGPHTSKFWRDEVIALEERLDDGARARLRDTLRAFPLVAVAPCGAVMLHAAPEAEITSVEQLEHLRIDGYEDMHFSDFLRVPVLGPLLWSRMATEPQAERFVRTFGSSVAIYGHDIVREGWAKDGPRQLCVSTSFGLWNEDKAYVRLDLAATYRSVDDLREGHELLRLWS